MPQGAILLCLLLLPILFIIMRLFAPLLSAHVSTELGTRPFCIVVDMPFMIITHFLLITFVTTNDFVLLSLLVPERSTWSPSFAFMQIGLWAGIREFFLRERWYLARKVV
jgi:hypothetical protein